MGLGLRRTVSRFTWSYFVALTLLVLSCGRYPLGNKLVFQAPGSAVTGKKLTLALFGAAWSPESLNGLPEVQASLDKLSEEDRKALDVVLYVPTGPNPAVAPTQENADQLLAATGVKGRALPDEWRWKNFKNYIGGNNNLPAAAVVDLDGNVLKAFRAGPTSFVPAEIAAAARDGLHRFKSVKLALFGAPWCSECKTEMPAIQERLDRLSRTQLAYIDVTLYVTTAANPSVPPTQEIADSYLETVHVKGKALPDEWRWKNFKAWVGGSFALPGAAVLDAQGHVLKAWRAGPTTFVPGEIVDFAVKSTQ